ncbi:MAG: alcohol dehydrogenase catalytic domain-containing protein [Candidatus Dormibacteraeota bacterium]|nr:alcohol dehydrogenase catalytic domain-containing protein [Candidatus Dormibacteraeota bacterium]MBV9525179.1 alcohol dehydrogenase catalytic domain-containing protein [Candidatus Dormibacteraeota bacterium]
MTEALPETMRAARAYAGERHMRVEQVPTPQPGAGEVLVRVHTAGLTRGLIAMWWFTNTITLPGTLGHDIAGTVAAVGPDVEAFREGDRVWVSTALNCGTCASCLAGLDNMCSALGVIGYALYAEGGRERYERYHDGGFAEYVLAPAANLNRLPAEVPLEIAGKLGTIAGGLRVLLTAGTVPGGTLAVTAAGGATGAAVARLAPVLGFARVIAIARSRGGLERLAAGQPGDVVTLATDELGEGWETAGALTERIREAAGGDGVDAAVDLMPMGTDATVQLVRSLRPGGHAVLMGGNPQSFTLSYLDVMRNQWTLSGNRGHRRGDELAVANLIGAGLLKVDDLLTHTFPLDGVNDAIDLLMSRAGHPGMVTLRPLPDGARV